MTSLKTKTQTVVQPKIVVKTPVKSKETPVKLASYHANVVVDATVYRVSLEMTFKNTLADARELECEALVPLPTGAMIDGYALDVNGALVDASAVTKEKARVALEKEERRKVDPGIAEHVQGNIFRTRIYPLVDERRVRVDYVAPLEMLPNEAGLLCSVGMVFDDPVDDFLFEVLVKDQPNEEGARLEEHFQTNRSVEEWEEMGFARSTERSGWLATFRRKNFQPTKNARVVLPIATFPKAQFERTDHGVFIVAPLRLPRQEIEQTSTESVALDEITIIWDASASREGKGDVNGVESVFLNAALRKFQCKRLRFIPVRNDVDETEIKFINNDGGADNYLPHQALDLIESTPCDGATNLAAALAYAPQNATTFIFSDGLNNWGEPLDEAPETGRVFTFSSGDKVDAPTLKRIASAGGGAYFNLDVNSPNVICEQLAHILTGRLQIPRFVANNLELANATLDASSNAEYRLIAAKIIDDNLPIALECSLGNKIILSLSYQPERWRELKKSPRRGANLQSFFAQTRLDSLLPSMATKRDEIEKLGLQFELATPLTSLIVMESLEQYIEHKICPPESLPEMREAFLERAQREEESSEEKRLSRLAFVKRLWESRLEWYNTDFTPKKINSSRASSPSFFSRWRNSVQSRREPLEDFTEPRNSDSSPIESNVPEIGAQFEEMEPESRYVTDNHPEEYDRSNPTYDDHEDLALYSCVSSMACEMAIPKTDGDKPISTPVASIRLAEWNPNCKVAETLATLSGTEQISAYLKARNEFGNAPTFFFACAELFHRQGNRQLALRALSNLSESNWDDQQLLRPLAKKLLALNEIDLAIAVFQRVMEYRPEEPQSYRDLALALEERADLYLQDAKQELAIQEYRRALELLSTVIYGRKYEAWDERFPEIEVIALEDACGIAVKLKRLNVLKLPIDSELIVPFEIDMRITLTWSADNTDFDLWVFEPDGTKVYYGANRSHNGGLLSCDYRDGYGPEEYLVRKAPLGKYQIVANYFSSRALTVLGEIYLEAEVVTNFGRVNQSRERIGFALRDAKSEFVIGEVEY